MLPTVGNDTVKIVRYAAEVAGRTYGIASMVILVPEAEKRAALIKSADVIKAAASGLASAYTARVLFEMFELRLLFGRGRGIDRGFDALVSTSSETVRTSLPDRTTDNPDYRAIFPQGAKAYTSPTIREDAEIAEALHKAVSSSTLSVKAEILADLDAAIPIIGPAATALRDGEKNVDTLFQAEMNGRKLVVDGLWGERKVIESTLGRSGRGLARFIFFDFRKGTDDGGAEDAKDPQGSSDPDKPDEPK